MTTPVTSDYNHGENNNNAATGVAEYGTSDNSLDNKSNDRRETSGALQGDLLTSTGAPQLCQRRSNLLLLIYFPMYFLYVSCAALIFIKTEGIIEEMIRTRLRKTRGLFLEKNPCVSDANLEELILELMFASDRGVSAATNSSGESNWSFGQSFFFSFTIITTIGYGNVHPLSEEGKLFCIAYAIFGIPMTFMLLNALVDRLMLPSTFLLQWLIARLHSIDHPLRIQVLHLCVVGVVSFLLFMLFPGLIFAEIEQDWTIFDSIYYCFISLTTIGLGDFIPGDSVNQDVRPFYKIATTIYLLLGLSAVMLLLRLYGEIQQLNLGIYLLPRHDRLDPEKIKLVALQRSPHPQTQAPPSTKK
uniref:Potassium channel subfamily K member 1-like n=1 Tax=Hirondellea gigas TaxID=1518452 RepID=A0A2P2I4Z0_9CRUS